MSEISKDLDREPSRSKTYRFKYVITDVQGNCSDPNLKPGTFVYEDHYRGRSSDWNVYEFPPGESPKWAWGFSGTYIGKIPLAEFEAMPRG